MNPENIQYFDKKCPNIEGVYYCQKTSYEEKTNNSQCIGNLLNNRPAHCELHDKERTIEIFQPEPNYIVLINIPETTITTTCGPNKQKIKGSALIQFNQCDIKINDVTYTSSINTYWDEINIYPTIFNEINITTTSNNIRLKNLENYQFADRGFIDLLEPYVHREDLLKTFGTFSIITAIIIALAYLGIYRKLHNYSKSSSIIPINAPANEPARIQFLWPSLNSREGGVTSIA